MTQLILMLAVIFGKETEAVIPIREFIRTPLRISATMKSVAINGVSISPVIINPKDKLPDLPDSAFDGWRVRRIYDAAIKDPVCCGCKPEYNVDPKMSYAFSKPIILSLSDAGWLNYQLKMHDDSSESESIRLQVPEDCEYGAETMSNQILLYKDSVVLFKRRSKGFGKVSSIPLMANSIGFSELELKAIKTALKRLDAKTSAKVFVAIDPHPSTSMKKIFQITSLLNKSKNGKGVFIPFLIGIYICRNPDAPE